MMNCKLLFLSFLLCASTVLMAQKHTFSGVVMDEETKEPLLGANVWLGTTGTVTDFDGVFTIDLENGTYEVQVSYVGYEKQTIDITIAGSDVKLDVKLAGSQMLKEVMVTADIARARETPVAFSNITPIQLEEELAAQELPMVLNSTPGAYATQSGGGDGDARITIRGFNQRNVAVMLDGIPVNDMENGWVYWSNWFGLDLVTQRMQVQRGLGASKLSTPSVGGTINILTKGIDNDRSLKLRQEIGNDGFFRTTFGMTTGRMKGGWGISAAGSYKTGDGWVDAAFTEGYFYYLRVDKKMGDHLISLSGFGAPQEHGQRTFTNEIAFTDADYARELGVPENAITDPNTGLTYIDRGRRFNENWGYRDGELFSVQKNYYHKPQFSLRHSWQANEKTFWSNVAYLSIGNGGGTAPASSSEGAQSIQRLDNGLYDIEGAIEANQLISAFRPEPVSTRILRSSINNHFWYGFLSTLSYTLSPEISLSGGLDGRYYRGDHYREVYDLLGGDYFIFTPRNAVDRDTYQIDLNQKLEVGDKMFYDYSGFVRSAGAFGQLEWKKNDWTAFVNLSAALSSYSIEDYMRSKVVTLEDSTFNVSFNKPVTYNDVTYTVDSPEAKNKTVDWITIPSFTYKMGASRKLGDRHSVFANTGYLSKAQRFNNVINTRIYESFEDYKNEKILAFELGYSYTSSIFSANLNVYHTAWENKPLESPPTVAIPYADGTIDEDSERIPVNVSGIDALHKGIELDFAFKPSKKFIFEGLVSLGDWRWTSSETVEIYADDGQFIRTYEFDATGVHVGDAAQTQFGGLLRYEPIKGLYFKLRGTYFDNNYAAFQPEDLKPGTETARRDSWKLPDYMLYNFHLGYNFNINKTRFGLRFNVLNLFDTIYISDANNNDSFNERPTSNFDAQSASVHFGQGRRWTSALSIDF